ncbi:MAG: UDP-N-acetylmuramoyl-L-alanine--D-glutamate ligase [Armatimonadota bacterium]|nr:UDP-N-acetylmuramoyl-L-alanine--D-glutamate ligase [Armatimonadota bacterium]
MNGAQWQDKHILVVGIGRSGYDAARVLHALGARVTACDSGSPPLAEQLASLGVNTLVGWEAGLPTKNYELVVTSPGVPADSPILQEAIQEGIPVWSEVELAYHLSRAPVIGVTGTNGKSTTAALIAHILSTAGYRAVLCGNIAAEGMERTLTDAAFLSQPEEILVAEVSSFQLEWVHEFRPHVGVWTTLSPDHLNRHSSLEEYGRTKARLFLRQTEADFAVVPGDDALILSFMQTRAKYIYFSHKDININAQRMVWCDTNGVHFKNEEGVRHLASIEGYQLRGEHNRRNLAAAVAACLAWNIASERLEEAISTFRPLPHRMEWVAEVDGVQYVNNSMCTNLQAVAESLKATPAPVVLIMGGVDKSSSPFQNLVPLLQQKARGVVLIGEDAQRIESQLREAGWEHIVRCDSLQEAVLRARNLAYAGDWVMLSPGCASFDMFTSFQERGEAFRRIVRRLEERNERDATS